MPSCLIMWHTYILILFVSPFLPIVGCTLYFKTKIHPGSDSPNLPHALYVVVYSYGTHIFSSHLCLPSCPSAKHTAGCPLLTAAQMFCQPLTCFTRLLCSLEPVTIDTTLPEPVVLSKRCMTMQLVIKTQPTTMQWLLFHVLLFV
jgi:hypothetical protein